MRIALLALIATGTWAQPVYDIVVNGGRVIDPESKLDAIRHLGIRGRSIETISATPLKGRVAIDAKGLVVAPGFIDLHAHGQDGENHRYQVRDGVTTALELEVGVSPAADWYARRGKAVINYGATAGHIPARMRVMKDSGTFLPRDAATNRRAIGEEVRAIREQIAKDIDDGALGLGFGINYVPSTTREEVLDLFQIAADKAVPVFVHIRHMGAIEPGNAIDAVQEVIADAASTGAALHIVHITSVGLRLTPVCLRMIEGARHRGVDVTTEAYPYTAAMTGLETALFNAGWQERLGIGYKDVQWVATGERLTDESFARYRQQGGMVIMHMIPEEIVGLAMAHPRVMIASDGSITGGKGHPRGAGTYARVLGRYVREQKALSLNDAIAKMSLMPAQRLERAVPQMRLKGRIKTGADADIAIFDPARVADRATFENPAQYSDGILHVLVNGVAVVRDGKLVDGAQPGVAIRR